MTYNQLDTTKFIEKAKQVHGNKFDYSKVNYINSQSKITIVCPEHGEWQQIPNSHLRGSGCPECGKEKQIKKQTSTTEKFIEKAKQVHGDKYVYSKVEYINNTTKVCIICPEHGEFYITPANFLSGRGCKACGYKKRAEKQYDTDETFIKKAKQIHGDKYDYSKTKYVNTYEKIVIVCPEHGEFSQQPNAHLQGRGCPKCGRQNIITAKMGNTETFVKKAKQVHGNKYDYSNSLYTKANDSISIICPKHGTFKQRAADHLEGKGCPVCAHTSSKGEQAIYDYLKELLGEDNVFSRNRSILANKYELDIYIPEKKIAIEYDGLRWHSEKFAERYNLRKKTDLCREQGIKLIHIFEDEWLEHPEIVKDKLRSYLGVNNDVPVIGARKCIVKEISNIKAKAFLDKNHIQGFASSTVYLGAFYEDKLMAVMDFKSEGNKGLKWDLNRFATDNEYRVPGIASKMFQYFIKNYNFSEIKSFLDLRWNWPGNTLYEKLGFELEGIERPDYYYVTPNNERIHKFSCRKQRLNKTYGLPLTMAEKEMTDELGFYRIYNCGLAKYIFKK